jgi:hypothetical protein
MQDPLLKLAKARRAGGMTHVVEHLPSMLEALRSNLSTTKKKKKKKNQGENDLRFNH